MRQIAPALLLAAMSLAQAQDTIPMDQPLASRDAMRGVVGGLANMTNGLRMCLGPEHTTDSLRDAAETRLQRMGVQGLPTPNQILLALSTEFPCPFSPYGRVELQAAERADLEGVWLMPPSSMKLFLPPKSPARAQEKVVPLKCEVVAFLPEGESRTAELRGNSMKCPEKAADFAAAGALPRVVSWDMPSPGKVVLTRSDIAGHVEEWEAFVVKAPFEVYGVSFRAGDLVEYGRKHPGIAQPFAYRFRHLQRLP